MSKIVPQVKSITTNEIIFVVDEEDIRLAISARLKPDYDATFDDPIAQGLKKIGHYRQVYIGWCCATGYKGPIRHEFRILNTVDEIRQYLFDYMHGNPLGPIEVKLFFEQEVMMERKWGQIKPKKKEPMLPGKIIGA